VTRPALYRAVTDLTGQVPWIFEPSFPADTGAYCAGGVGYCVAGGWGSLAAEFQSFVTISAVAGIGIVSIAGYGTGGALVYENLSLVSVGPSNSAIVDCVCSQVPLGSIIWMRIEP